MDDLADYLRREAGRPFARGAADCVALCCDWIVLRRGVDPIAQWRGYSTDTEAAALIRAQGSMARLAGLAMRHAGIRLTRDPRPGDVAVVAPMSGTHQTCAIRTERGWVMRLDDGIAMVPAGQMRVLAAWRV